MSIDDNGHGGTTMRAAWGYGLATMTASGDVLDVWYPQPHLGIPDNDSLAPAHFAALEKADIERDVTRKAIRTVIDDLDTPPATVEDAYLRLHLLSHRLALPNSMNLDGIFGVLPNVVWTSAGPCAVDGFELTRLRLMAAGRHVTVYGIDKFPRMVDYVVPAGVRIGDADRVRLGAHLAPGTTVMHEGFCNFNAGTLGTSMVEGRIAQGVIVGDGSDIGGGASIMGTLSGGGRERVSIGQRTLLGANSGCGIALGDDCVVEAGLYVTAGTKVTVTGWGDDPREGTTLKARELSGANGVMFIRNSVSGAIEARPRKGIGIALNSVLHKQ